MVLGLYIVVALGLYIVTSGIGPLYNSGLGLLLVVLGLYIVVTLGLYIVVYRLFFYLFLPFLYSGVGVDGSIC